MYKCKCIIKTIKKGKYLCKNINKNNLILLFKNINVYLLYKKLNVCKNINKTIFTIFY